MFETIKKQRQNGDTVRNILLTSHWYSLGSSLLLHQSLILLFTGGCGTGGGLGCPFQ